MAALVDTNILVYPFDRRSPRKKQLAIDLLDRGIAEGSLRIAHQAVIEFYAAVTKPNRDIGPLLTQAAASREVETLLTEFDVLFPDETVVRTALRGVAAHGMSWYDAHMWAHAEVFGLAEMFSEDLQHGRTYGRVRVTNPFA